MLSFAHAVARLLVSCTTPPLLAEYGITRSCPKMEVIDPMLMILPLPAAAMCGYASRHGRNVPVRLMSMIRFQSSSV